MSVDYCLMQKRCGNETSPPIYVLITQARNAEAI